MSRLFRPRIVISCILGIVLGLIAESVTSRWGMPFVIREGALWGAVAGLTIGYLPDFIRMGAELTRRDNKAVNLLAGVGIFLVVAIAAVAFFMGLFWVIGWLFVGGA